MTEQDGTLIIVVRDFRTSVALDPGHYFGLKVGDNCIRFNQLQDEFKFSISRETPGLPIELFLIHRRPRVRRSAVGRRRDLVDRCEVNYAKLPFTQSSEFCVEWQSVELKLVKARMTFLADIEFYPAVPRLPSKGNRTVNRVKPEQEIAHLSPERIEVKEAAAPTSRREMKGEIPSDKTSKMTKRSGSRRKRDKFKALLVGTPRNDDSDAVRHSDKIKPKRDPNVIFYDLSSPHGAATHHAEYKHGEVQPSLHEISAAGSGACDLADEISGTVEEDDVLPLDVSPREFFNEVGNRVKHNQKMNFSHMFSSHNTRITSYLGKGRWSEPLLPNSLLNWYLQPAVKSLPGPPLPPKCPRGMLWEEHYLLNHELYSKTVLR